MWPSLHVTRSSRASRSSAMSVGMGIARRAISLNSVAPRCEPGRPRARQGALSAAGGARGGRPEIRCRDSRAHPQIWEGFMPTAPASPDAPHAVTVTVNGRPETLRLPARRSLLHALREDLNLTGTKEG